MATCRNNSASRSKIDPLADWMKDLPANLCDVPLRSLFIPGTHDSGTCQLRQDLGIGPDTEGILKTLSAIPCIGSVTRSIIQRWSKCQKMSISEQLNAGVRYLDVRVARCQKLNDLRVIHALYGSEISSCMEEVKQFLAQHEQEVVLLDFNHFYGMDEQQHSQLIAELTSTFEGSLCPYSYTEGYVDTVTLRGMRQNNTRLIIFYHYKDYSSSLLWPDSTIVSHWSNTMNVAKCWSDQEEAARKGNPDGFYVFQAVLTPDTKAIVLNCCGSVEDGCAKKINPTVPDHLQSGEIKACGGMIFIVDFVEQDNIVQTIIELNK